MKPYKPTEILFNRRCDLKKYNTEQLCLMCAETTRLRDDLFSGLEQIFKSFRSCVIEAINSPQDNTDETKAHLQETLEELFELALWHKGDIYIQEQARMYICLELKQREPSLAHANVEEEVLTSLNSTVADFIEDRMKNLSTNRTC